MSIMIRLTVSAALGVALTATFIAGASANSDRVAWLELRQRDRETSPASSAIPIDAAAPAGPRGAVRGRPGAPAAPAPAAAAATAPSARLSGPSRTAARTRASAPVATLAAPSAPVATVARTTTAALVQPTGSVARPKLDFRSTAVIGGRIMPQPLTAEENRTRATAMRTAALSPGGGMPQMDPKYLPADITFTGTYKPGTIVIDTTEKYLYLVHADGTARRYGVGVGRPGFQWAGTHRVSMKREWPGWSPPAMMRKRQPELPTYMEGGPENPLGARAMYLGSSLYRIHGSNAPWTIGTDVSSGCIRMRNEDVTELYEQVKVGTKVVVLR